jgi:hypothetical protein
MELLLSHETEYLQENTAVFKEKPIGKGFVRSGITPEKKIVLQVSSEPKYIVDPDINNFDGTPTWMMK